LGQIKKPNKHKGTNVLEQIKKPKIRNERSGII